MGANDQGASATEGRWLVMPRTLCFVTCGDDVLLIKRASTRRVFPNRYNGLGGHIERDEDPLSSVRREVLEESGLRAREFRLRAISNVDAGEPSGILLFVFTAVTDVKDLGTCDEGTLHWVPRSQVLTLDLVEDLPYLLPRILDMRDDDSPWFIHLGYDQVDGMQMRFADAI